MIRIASIPFSLALATLLIMSGCAKPPADNAKKPEAPPADAIEKYVEKGPVKMTVRLSPKTLPLSDMAQLEIAVTAENNVEVKPPAFGQAVGDFIVRDYKEKRPGPTDENTRRFIYTLEPMHAGTHLIRTVSIEFIDKRPGTESKGDPLTLETDPFEITVTSELGDKTPSLADLAPMAPPEPLPPAPIWYWVIGFAAVAGAVAAFAIWRSRRKQAVIAAEIKRSPEEIAAEELKKLLAENLHGKGLYKDFYIRLTGIVRRYIEGTTGIHAPEQTTEEFLRDMRASQIFPPERSVQLANFLEAADMVKYAAVEPTERQLEESIARAQEFVGLPTAFRPLPETVGAA